MTVPLESGANDMEELYRMGRTNEKPEYFASLSGAADRWRETGATAVAEQISASGEVLRVVPQLELRCAVNRVRGQSTA